MKKSEIYKAAQIAVLNSMSMCDANKLVVLKELMSQENLAKFIEEKGENNETL
jgi:hypothetical protein